MPGTYALGIDFGGTKVLAGVVDLKSGEVIGSAKKKTRSSDGPEQLMERIYTVADGALKDARKANGTIKLHGIGIGMAGQVDVDQGVLLGTPNLSQATVELPITAQLTKRFGVPAFLRNDVQIAAIGEQHFGAGRGCDDFVCIFVGTGIGGAIVRNGALIEGASGTAGELGHVVIAADGRLCGCGGRGHLEAYASRTAITNWLLGELRRGGESAIVSEIDTDLINSPGGMAIRSGTLARAVDAGDSLAIAAIREAGRFLGLGLVTAINVLNPKRIVLGGGVIEAVDLLFDEATAVGRRESLAVPGGAVEIVKAGLGDDSGVVGAAIMAATGC